ncbi:peptidylprolyl isomerase [Pelagivirga sediminicola]|uniref:Peptidylprolyl isomerase n=1 Tax=Pelagivirga sediminicola TaxID=2170575 RepID=A0A2T7GBH8_9RHOB|nr:peptidylprolyl isomerase [Pelagivirga sediminicola]PVA11774.1 peptidylprolyl isomerase [Pelagivirga sediminicola]
MRSSSISKSAMWILMGLLILGLGGFSVTNFSGGISRIGVVGDTEISVTEYSRALRAEVNAATAETGAPVSFAQAEAQGMPQRVLSRLVAQAALEDETARMGISVGDETLARQIKEIPGFQGVDGAFDRAGYSYALERAGLSEAEFEKDVRDETAGTLVQGAVISGVSTPAAYTDTLLSYIAEERSVTYAALTRADLTTGLPVPTDADLEAFYQANLPSFTTPEVKRITYAWMTPAMIIDDVEVSQDALREAYDARLDEFQKPERRLAERLVFPDAEAADAARAKVDSGEAGFDDLVAERGLSLQDVDLGDVEKSDLGGAGDAVFAVTAGDVVGPEQTDLGPALFRVNAVLQAQNTSFEEAEPQLRDELAGDRAARVVEGAIEAINDLLAGGATIEELADETQMEIGTVDWHPALKEGIAAYGDFRSAAQAVQDGDFPEVKTLDDGGIFALRLDEIVEPTVQPMEDVQQEVAAAWAQDALIEALRAQAEPAVEAIRGGASFEEQGLVSKTAEGLTRQGFQEGTPPGFIPALFDMDEGDVATLAGDERLFIYRLDEIALPDADPDTADGEYAQIRQTLRDSAANDIAQDLYQALANDIRARSGITLDQQAINAVHANFQ